MEIAAEADVTYRIDFIGTRRGFDAASEPVHDEDGNDVYATRRYSDDIGTVLRSVEGTNASYEFTGNELYVRATITSSKLHPNPSQEGEMERAWAQPVLGAGVNR